MLQIPHDQVRLATVNGDLPHRQLGTSSRGVRYTREDIGTLLTNQARVGVAGRAGGGGDEVVVMAAPKTRRSVA